MIPIVVGVALVPIALPDQFSPRRWLLGFEPRQSLLMHHHAHDPDLSERFCFASLVPTLRSLEKAANLGRKSGILPKILNHFKNFLMGLFLMGCFQWDFRRENGPLRHSGKRHIEGERPTKKGNGLLRLMGCFRAPPPSRGKAPLKNMAH